MTELKINGGILSLELPQADINLWDKDVHFDLGHYLNISNDGQGGAHPFYGKKIDEPTLNWASSNYIPVTEGRDYEIRNTGDRKTIFFYTSDTPDINALWFGLNHAPKTVIGSTTTFTVPTGLGITHLRFQITLNYPVIIGVEDTLEVIELGVPTEVKSIVLGDNPVARRGWSTNEVQIENDCGKTIDILCNFTYDGTDYTDQESVITLLETIL